MSQIKIGDLVTGYASGYWQLIDIKPKIATEDYVSERIHWKKGQLIGQTVILKKCFTAKMKPKIDFTYDDAAYLKPVPDHVRAEIEAYFAEHPDYKQKFDTAEIKLRPSVLNCYLDLPEEKENDFRATLQSLPSKYTMEEFWKVAKAYKAFVSKPPTSYLLNLSTYPWCVSEQGEPIFFNWELTKC